MTLKGVASNLLAKEKVVRQAQMAKGIRAVVDQIEVHPGKITDADLSKDVTSARIHAAPL